MEIAKKYFRSIWLSDTHLGSRGAVGEPLYGFLRDTESEYLYLVGDIIDIWKLKRRWHWPEVNDRIMALVLEKARNGTQVIYIPGNHDEALRPYAGRCFNGVAIQGEAIHETAAGLRLLVCHGDEFDCVVQQRKWLAKLGGLAYDGLLAVNRWFNHGRRLLGLNYWSFSAYLKNRVKQAVNFVGRFEDRVAAAARRHEVGGLVCGHIHQAARRELEGLLYLNTGDWVESCTALTECHDGALELLRWTEMGLVPLATAVPWQSPRAASSSLPRRNPAPIGQRAAAREAEAA